MWQDEESHDFFVNWSCRCITLTKLNLMRIHSYNVYILTNLHHSVLYTGVTNDLERRCNEHRQKKVKGFTQKYNVDILVYFEQYDFIDLAIAREKQIKGYSRAKKIALIDQFNKKWKDLYSEGKILMPHKNEE